MHLQGDYSCLKIDGNQEWHDHPNQLETVPATGLSRAEHSPLSVAEVLTFDVVHRTQHLRAHPKPHSPSNPEFPNFPLLPRTNQQVFDINAQVGTMTALGEQKVQWFLQGLYIFVLAPCWRNRIIHEVARR